VIVRAIVAVLITMLAPVLANATPGEVTVGKSLREAQLRGLNGPSLQLSAFRGRPLLINVWASWCGPCRAEMASLERLAWLDPNRQYSIIGISTDDYFEQAAGWLQQTHSTLSHFIDHKLELENMLGAAKLPLTVLVDARGRVLQKVYGAREWDSPESIALIDRAFRKGANAP